MLQKIHNKFFEEFAHGIFKKNFFLWQIAFYVDTSHEKKKKEKWPTVFSLFKYQHRENNVSQIYIFPKTKRC